MGNVKKWYERRGKARPCFLNRDDILTLSGLIEETFTTAEKERFFRISTTIGNTRVFSNSTTDFLNQPGLPPKINDLSFGIEGWDKESRFDKNVLLDFSKYSIQLSVEGADPVWVYDKYNKIIKFLEEKTAWYWPIIVMEKYFIFLITLTLMGNIIISAMAREHALYLDKLGLIGLWVFLVFSDTRKVWPYAAFSLKGDRELWCSGNIVALVMILIFSLAILSGAIIPFCR